MEQQMMSLLGGEVAALLPGLTGTAPAETGSSAAPQAFADVLNTALEGLVKPDAAALALLAQQQLASLTPTPALAPIIPPTALQNLWSTTSDTLLAADAMGGSSLPRPGSDMPLFNPHASLRLAGNPNTTALQDFLSPDEVALGASEIDKTVLSTTPNSKSPLTPITTAVPVSNAVNASDSEIELSALRMDSAGVVANTSDGMGRRESSSNGGGNDERAAHAEQKSQVMQSLSALSSVITPLNGGTAGAQHDSEATTTLPSFARAMESISITPDSNGTVGGGLSTPLSNSAAPKGEFSIAQSPLQPGWGDAFTERVTFMLKQNLQEAEIRLNPPHLGQIDVRISMIGDQANLMISSPHASVREAIESSIVRLRELLGESGINLANVDVSDKSLARQQQNANGDRDENRPKSWNGYRAEFALDANVGEILGASGSGRIDYFV